jgi:hypothetical protein
MIKTKIKTIGIKMPNFQRWNLYILFFILSVTGLLWTSLHEIVMSKDLKFMHQLIIIHGIFALFWSVIFGSIMTQHIRLAWHANRNRLSGSLNIIFFVFIMITGLGLYYANEDQHNIFKWIHILLGVILIIALPLHIFLGRKRVISKSFTE